MAGASRRYERRASRTSACAIAAAAGVNQALIFYLIGLVGHLVDVAYRTATIERVTHCRPRFTAVGSLRELLQLGRERTLARHVTEAGCSLTAAAAPDAASAGPTRPTTDLPPVVAAHTRMNQALLQPQQVESA